jgi:hypothetical protein
MEKQPIGGIMKVKVKSIEKKQWNEKTFFDITIEGDDRQFTCWNDGVKDWKDGGEYEAEISEKDTDKGKKYYIRVGGQQQQGKGGGWKPKDKKEIAINCATAITCKMVEKAPTVETNDTLMALKFFYENIYTMIKD